MSGIIGIKIKEFRKNKGITQEELGRMVGVTTQAVSKWECGGVPDAELLPAIAENLGTSIDALFGKTDEIKQNLEQLISYELINTNEDERFEKAFKLCWAIEIGLTGMDSVRESFAGHNIENFDDEHSHQYYSKLLFNQGLTDMKLAKSTHYFFIMPEPSNGFDKAFGKISEYSDTFKMLSDERVLKIIMFMYSRKNNTAITSALIAKNTRLSEDTVRKIMDKMCEYNMADCFEVETNSGIICSYRYRQECAMIPLLFFAKELKVRNMFDVIQIIKRDKPIL